MKKDIATKNFEAGLRKLVEKYFRKSLEEYYKKMLSQNIKRGIQYKKEQQKKINKSSI